VRGRRESQTARDIGLVAMRFCFVFRYCDFVLLFAACNPRASAENLICVCSHFSLDKYVCSTYIRRVKRVSLFLPEPQIAALKRLSKRAGIKASELIRRFIDEGLKRA
jgi:hypothetical protein